MDSASFIKVACLLSVAVCIHISTTAPTARQDEEDGAVIKSSGEKLLRFAASTVAYWKCCIWIATLAEIVVLLARAYPSLPISSIIRNTFLFGGDESKIRLTNSAVVTVPLSVAATALRLWCYRELGKHFTFDLCIHKDHTLVTTGPYSIVRHPSYTGVIIQYLVIYLLYGTRGSWIRESGLMNTTFGRRLVFGFVGYTLIAGTALLSRMRVEDQELRSHFGKQWDDWAARVRCSLVPGIL